MTISPVGSKADRRAFIDLPWTLYANDPNWRPPLKADVKELINPTGPNPWFQHGKAEFFLAKREGKVVGRISAQVCQLVQERRPGLGQWGLFETIDDPEVAQALIATAEGWLRQQGMTQAQGPISISTWDEPGLLVQGFDRPPRVMMGHHLPYYEAHILAAGYAGVKDLQAWSVAVADGFPEIVNRIVAAGEKNSRIRIRQLDMSRYEADAAILLDILNEAWSENWGYVPLTDSEKRYITKKLKPLAYPHLVQIAEYEGEPAAFMISMPDLNQLTQDLDGRLLPFGWAKLLLRLRNPQIDWFRVPLMGVRRKLQATRTASMLAFMMIEYTRRAAVPKNNAKFAEVGWILEDNGPMLSIAKAIEAEVTSVYRIFERPLKAVAN